MSIINDALKKARQNRGDFPVKDEYLNRSIEGIIIDHDKKTKLPRSTVVSFLSVILVVGGVFLINNLFTQVKPVKIETPPIVETQPAPVSASIPVALPIPEPGPEIALPPVQSEPPMINLTGIFYDSSGAFITINDSIFEEGENYNGVKIVKIFPDKVGFSFEGKYFTIKLK